MKRRKDSGFTLIELMIVIAVIGILAIVLVPRVGTVKTQAKEAGLDTNVRLVQGYVESKINKWVSSDIDQSVVVNDIEKAFTFTDSTKKLVNPITNLSPDPDTLADTAITGKLPLVVLSDHDASLAAGTQIAGAEGSVIVAVTATATNAVITEVTIYAYGTDGNQLSEKTVTITP